MYVYGDLKYAQAHLLAADPTPGKKGLLWFNTATNLLKYDDGTNVRVLVNTAEAQNLSTKGLEDSSCYFYDNSDTTKKFQVQCSGITASNTRTWTVPDSNDTFVGLAATQTLTNKTLTSPVLATSARFSYATASTVPYFDSNKDLISSATTPTQLGYLASATGTTGTASTNLVFSTSPTLTTPNLTSPVIATSARFSYATASTVPYFDSNKDLISSATTPTQLGYLASATGTTGTASTNLVFSASPTFSGTVTLPSGSVSASAWSYGSSTFTGSGSASFTGTSTANLQSGTSSQLFTSNEFTRIKAAGTTGMVAQGSAGLSLQYLDSHDTAITNHHRGILSNYNRTITTGTTDTGSASLFWGRFDATGAATLTNSNATMGYTTVWAAAPAVSSTTLAYTHFSGIFVETSSLATGTNKYGIYVGAQTGATNNYGVFVHTSPVALFNQSELRLYEGSSGANYTGFKAASSLSADTIYTMPTGDGTGGYVLSTNGSGVLSWIANASGGFDSALELTNYSISCSVAASALTIALKKADGSDATAGSPVKIAFRSATAATGTYTQRSVTAALSTVISSGSTAGFNSGNDEYLYVYAIDNAGTVELAWCTQRIVSEGTLVTTTAEGGGGAADSRTTLYSTTARSNVACRLLARMKFSLGTAGAWSEVPDEISLTPISNSYQTLVGELILAGGNGHGSSTGTKIRRFTAAEVNTLTDVTYSDSSTAGGSIGINVGGVYAIDYFDTHSSTATFGISLNSSQLTTNIGSITFSDVKAIAQPGANEITQMSVVIRLKPGDIIRAHTDGSTTSTTYTRMSIRRIAD